ncbi:YqiA/YcfP family alpha/beta fold hydrolase [Halochromatium glycolicum]|uniref:Esterase n=1 Tax=Halochromatium glycolicum TaxID=85075 RepID=A0AAJ0U4S0_9GAMM|nr:YqiA/YcfP family alpha/beta fold hydrolase [Halochromatium glycolicum]MBK1705278.1 hypothetical protein [Halochromatium glycolicum]
MAQIIYLHGFASGPKPQSPKVALLRTLGHAVHCLDTQGGYRPEDYQRAAAALHLAHSSPTSSPDPSTGSAPDSPTHSLPDLLVGSSLGGFWARRLGLRLGLPWIGLNPALRPSATLARYGGRLQRFDVDAHFSWRAEDALAYRPLEAETLSGTAPGLILVAEDDDVVDAQETLALAGDCERLVLPRGGHELANTADYADTLARFIERITVAAP